MLVKSDKKGIKKRRELNETNPETGKVSKRIVSPLDETIEKSAMIYALGKKSSE